MEQKPKETPPESPDGRRTPPRRGPNLFMLIVLALVIAVVVFATQGPRRSQITYDFFLDQIRDENVVMVQLGDEEALGMFAERVRAPKVRNREGELIQPMDKRTSEPLMLEQRFRVGVPPPEDSVSRGQLMELLSEKGVQLTNRRNHTPQIIFYTFLILLPLGLLLFFWLSMRRTRDQLMGGGFLSGFSKSPARRYEGAQQAVTFADVAGLEGVKADLQEIVDYLSSPEKFQRLGGRVPKGVLLNGPPGTGKTLLARAVAGEAGVPFYSVSGSEFIQMFVGVGASRVRDLFKTAKDNAPAIIFIDEIDAVGRQRGAGLGGGHDEREQTLNQILSEMDGFTPNDTVIVVAATNRPDVLDPALLRPGRFDRHVTVDRPTRKGRLEIFKVHVRDVPLDDDVDLERMAANTVGLTGADIRNVVNEAALWAARRDKNRVAMEDFDYARDKLLMGARREEILSDDEKKKTAYHEAGHTLAAWFLPGAHRVHKVTIIPRGRSLGVTQMMPSEEKLSTSEQELRDHLVMLLAGRAAERLVFDEISVGAENDLEQATGLARRMVTHWGMSDRLGPVSFKMSDEDPFLGRELHRQRQFSEHTMELIDEEVTRILQGAAKTANKLLSEHREALDNVANGLLAEEELTEAEITERIGPSVHAISEGNGRPPHSQAPQGQASESRASEAQDPAETEDPVGP